MEKKFERYERQKQVRFLERFLKKTTNMLKHPDVTKETFQKRIDKLIVEMEKLPHKVELQSSAYKELGRLIQYIINQSNSETKIEDIRANIFYETNQLEKNRNNNRYKKDKYKNFDDGWE